MMERMIRFGVLVLSFFVVMLTACGGQSQPPADAIKYVIETEPVRHDSDDPAIWIHPGDPAQSLVLGTDKHEDGALVVFNLSGKIIKRIPGIKRPNNVDIEYGFSLQGKNVDIAVVTERLTSRIRVFLLPDVEAIDNGGIDVFVGETHRLPMGIALYKRSRDNAVFAVLSRKTGPKEGYLQQYRLREIPGGTVTADKVRSFGTWSGTEEIESVAVDDEAGYVYYSDEAVGVRKYHADPDATHANKELALLATDKFREDREGISIYTINDGTGYILVSDQAANAFHVYPREGSGGDPHHHPLLKVVYLSTTESDGSDVTNAALSPLFPEGLFVAMSNDKTFHYYSWSSIAGQELAVALNGIRPGG
jgi:3-phytase